MMRGAKDESLRGKLSTLIEMGYGTIDAALSLCQENGSLENAIERLGHDGCLHRRFSLACSAEFAGTYCLDGTFCGATRYRHCGRNDFWILRSAALFESGFSWKACRDPEGKEDPFEIGLPLNAEGRLVTGIAEIPSEGWAKDAARKGPYQFAWIDDSKATFDHREPAEPADPAEPVDPDHNGDSWIDLDESEEPVEITSEDAM